MPAINYTFLDRFLAYTKFDTQSDENSETFPSTDKQKDLARFLVTELLDMGLSDAHMDDNGYVMATLPGNVDFDVPTIGLIAHLDTSPEVSGKDVNAVIHKNYDGGDIVLPKDKNIVIKAADNPDLAAHVGNDIITTDGTTLLGADDKAGIAEIMDAVHHLVKNPDVPHGTIKVGFTPDEEVGKGADKFDVEKFGADYAYTIDGEKAGEVQDETFCADAATLIINGVNYHPGFAKGKLVNAIKIASEIIDQLPKDALSPETTEDREGFLHPYVFNGGVDQATIRFLVRDFTTDGLKAHAEFLKKTVDKVMVNYPKASYELKIDEYYRNMKYQIDRDPKVIDYAIEAVNRAGLTAHQAAIRGGTDGARLSYMGLLTPNLFTGGHNVHSKSEWIAVQDMQKAVDVILNLIDIWVEKSR